MDFFLRFTNFNDNSNDNTNSNNNYNPGSNTFGSNSGSNTDEINYDLRENGSNFEIRRFGIAIPLTTILLNYPNNYAETVINGNLNGNDLEEIDYDSSQGCLFSINILPHNGELVKKLQDTLVNYRKEKLLELSKNDAVSCCICFIDKDQSIELKCKHKFCIECIVRQVFQANKNTCPLCREIFIN